MKLKIIENSKSRIIETAPGDSLLTILRNHGYSIYAPCGGRGICGKCLVETKGIGHVLSCTCRPDKDIEIILPGKVESNILTSQTDYLEDLPFDMDTLNHIHEKPYGVAIDIGTTTVVLYILDLLTGRIEQISSFLNPQSVYGADVITRIEYCQKHEKGLNELQMSIVNEINNVLDSFAGQVSCTSENFEKLIFVGNTAMLHILLGEDPVSIALAPFTPKFTDKQTRKADRTKFNINAAAAVVTLPCLSAYVGADIVAGLAALKVPHNNYIYNKQPI